MVINSGWPEQDQYEQRNFPESNQSIRSARPVELVRNQIFKRHRDQQHQHQQRVQFLAAAVRPLLPFDFLFLPNDLISISSKNNV